VSDPQSQWALFLLESLVEAGVRDVVVSPGSRSTPLVWAAAQTRELRIAALIDERSAAFYALGQARVSGRPSLLICTSGTAASNYFPAVIEARESGVPLIVLSADRPFELMHCGAHQTIDQTRLFGAYAPYHELGAPVADSESLLGLRRSAWQAVMASLTSPRGAVHLNFRARKPLEPRLDVPSVELPPLAPRAALYRDPPGSSAAERVHRRDLDTLLSALADSTCPLLICGAESAHDSASPELVERFAELTGSIVCPESVSQLRFRLPRAGRGLLCDTYDWLLGSTSLSPLLGPDFALQLGGTPVSAALERLIQQPERSLQYAIAAESGWPDPLHKSASMLRARSGDLLHAAIDVLERRGSAAPRPRLELWRSAQAMARAAIDRHVLAGFGEVAAVATVVAALPQGSWLALGNSLPPRLLDRYAPAAARGVSVVSQRGASGIEGAIAGAFGAASQADAPLTLLLGDISFLHDIGSLWAAQPARTQRPPHSRPVVLVAINNDGGRIFEQLPIAGHPSVPLELWTTPHRMRLRGAAELYGIGYAEADDRGGLQRALEAAYASSGVTLVEVKVDADSALCSQRAVSAELEGSFASLAARARA
jgi:2-succinyl-5-enolpyruvyl-6-hydroxy-3-cyclohexene-1-carboxylate synthase